MAKRPHNFGIIDGGKGKGAVPISTEKQPALSVISTVAFVDAKQVLHEMERAFYLARKEGKAYFGVIYNQSEHSFSYMSSNNEEEFVPYAENLKFLFLAAKSFIEQIPKKYTDEVQSIDDILRAFEQRAEEVHANDPYGSLPPPFTRQP